jgi:hypothetical protein
MEGKNRGWRLVQVEKGPILQSFKKWFILTIRVQMRSSDAIPPYIKEGKQHIWFLVLLGIYGLLCMSTLTTLLACTIKVS